MLENALSGRSVSATACNKESSRAHTVISIQVKRKTEHGIVVDGELNLVDLAGSERVSKSGATGDRAKETQVSHCQAIADLSSNGRHVLLILKLTVHTAALRRLLMHRCRRLVMWCPR